MGKPFSKRKNVSPKTLAKKQSIMGEGGVIIGWPMAFFVFQCPIPPESGSITQQSEIQLIICALRNN